MICLRLHTQRKKAPFATSLKIIKPTNLDSVNNYLIKVKTLIKRTLHYYILLLGIIYDNIRYVKWSLIGWREYLKTQTNIEAQIIKSYHAYEKGLAMPEFRAFGIARLPTFVYLLEKYVKNGGSKSNIHYLSAILVLKTYVERHADAGIDVSGFIPINLLSDNNTKLATEEYPVVGGVELVSSEKLFSCCDDIFSRFCSSRRSTRDFDSTKPVCDKLLRAAIEIAKTTPSVCNRQSWKVHSYHNRKTIDVLLNFQNGNIGFGHRIPCLLFVTVDLQCFDGVIERNQPWIDGGMFSMTLILALHHLKLGAVPLNWCVPPTSDKSIRSIARIPEPESIVMLIGVGYPIDEAMVPLSQRRETTEIYFCHD